MGEVTRLLREVDETLDPSGIAEEARAFPAESECSNRGMVRTYISLNLK